MVDNNLSLNKYFNMKGYITLFVFLLISTVSFSQSKSSEKAAKAMTTEMVNVLSLDQSMEDPVYNTHLVKVQKLHENKKNDSLTKEEKTEEKKEIFAEAKAKFIEIFGKDKFKEWLVYQKEKREKNKI